MNSFHIGNLKRTARLALYACGAAIAVWLLSPVFQAAHLEAFSATISSMAISANGHVLASDDPSYPIIVEFLYQSRPGTVGLLRGLFTIWPAAGDWAFRLAMIASLGTILLSSAILARRWGGTAPWAGVAAIVLTSGIVEAAFGFNDNIISAAFVMAALCLIAPGAWAAAACAGVLMSLATLTRVDGMLALPSAAGFIWLSSERPQTLVRQAAAFAAGYLSGLWMLARLWDVNLLDAWRIVEYFKNVHESWNKSLGYQFWIIVLFFGLPMLFLIPLGIWELLKRSAWKSRLVLVVYPLVYGVLSVPRANQTRHYLLLLAPYIAITGGVALELLLRQLRTGARLVQRPAMAACLAIVLTSVLPPPFILLHDGPRAPIGRLWSPTLWFRWQRAIESDQAALGRVVSTADTTGRTVVITTSYDDDRFLHLRLLERGYRLLKRSESGVSCGMAVETYEHGSHEVFLLRTHNFYGLAPGPQDYLRALMLDTALQCDDLYSAHRVFLTSVGDLGDLSSGPGARAQQLFGFVFDRYRQSPAYMEFGDRPTLRHFWRPNAASGDEKARQLLIRVAELSTGDLRRLATNADLVLRLFHEDGTSPGELVNYETFRGVFATRYWTPPDVRPSSSP